MNVTVRSRLSGASVFLLIGAIAGLALLLVSLGARPAVSGADVARLTPTQAAASNPTVVSAGKLVEVARFDLPAPAYRLVWDAGRNAVWYATFRISGPDTLFELNTATGKVARYDLPDAEYNGYLSTIEVAPDGAIWLSEPYRLIRFDPATQRAAALDLEPEDRSAVPDALEEGNPVPGTWISSFAMSGPDVIVARNNILVLRTYDRDLRQVGEVPVPRAYAGAMDLAAQPEGDSIFVAPGLGQQGGVATLSMSGDLVSATGPAANRIETIGSDVFASAGGTGRWLLDTRAPISIPSTDTPESFIVARKDGDAIQYDAGASSINWISGGRVVSSLALERTPVSVPRPGGVTTGFAAPQISDMIFDDDDFIWYADTSSNQLVKLSR